MDPTQLQDDKENDIHSLEHDDGKGSDNVTDATGGSSGVAPPPKQSAIKKLWDKFNIYLILFFFVVVIAIAVVVFLTVKSRESAQQDAITSQGLSDDALKQLASTDVTVGNPRQILNIQANAVFAGAVLIRSNLEVAGTLKIGGALTLANLEVTGTSKLGTAEAKELTVLGAMTLQNVLTLRNGISVTGRSSFTGEVVTNSLATGALTLTGDFNLTQHLVAGGTIPGIERGGAVGGGGTVSLSGSDTSGSIAINTGGSPPAGCFATITFSKKFNNIPHVVVSPVGSAAAGLGYYVTRSTSGFVLCTSTPSPTGQSFGFDYVVLG